MELVFSWSLFYIPVSENDETSIFGKDIGNIFPPVSKLRSIATAFCSK